MKFQYGTKTIEFEVEYRDRKTLEIGIEPPDNIKVKAPKIATEEYILRVVKSKAKWITRKLFEFKDVEYIRRKKEYVNGESFMYLGRNYALQIIMNKDIKESITRLYQGKFYIETNTKNQDKLRQSMERWYREKTLEKAIERIQYYKSYFDLTPNVVRVKEQKKRWASCSSKRNLNFNWRCSMAPSNVLDYIVVHEMCHMVHFNHSKAFWNLVGKIIPDYKERKEWLRHYGIRMDL
ncbi:M48 family metallopeptidase [Clostridiisalibacter paucivorans]|uniref:M48 family metallopeptidase n=1 Tax=Clostridiisalibacter paucivorans TaxID=408753 RepID=UPI000AFE01C9|nr:SprT family zinc-dependent metalloprotease [Clostridiisalibacter paucivorans]